MRRRAKRDRDIEPLGSVLSRDKLVKAAVAESHAPVAQRDWEIAVGSRIAAKTRPTRLDRGVLYVATASAAWAQELSILSESILAQLGRLGVEVKALRFRVGKIERPDRPVKDKRVSPAPLPLPSELAEAVDAVGEPELREAIRRAAGRSLGWQKMNRARR
jgi:predicted nucleic acid-binding Zn ribbon protein